MAESDCGTPNISRRTISKTIALGLAPQILLGCGGSTSADGVLPPPGKVIDLSHLAITIPVDETGGTTGTAKTLKPMDYVSALSDPALTSTSELAPYIYTEMVGGISGVTLWCPVTGAHSVAAADGTPRTEFRHQVVPNSYDSWDPTLPTARTLTMTAAVTQVPPEKKSFIICQVHGHKVYNVAAAGNINAAPMLLVYFEPSPNGADFRIRAKLRQLPDSNFESTYETRVLMDHLNLDEEIRISVEVMTNTISVNKSVFQIPAAWAGVATYFKAGVYIGENGLSSREGGRVHVRGLSITVT